MTLLIVQVFVFVRIAYFFIFSKPVRDDLNQHKLMSFKTLNKELFRTIIVGPTQILRNVNMFTNHCIRLEELRYKGCAQFSENAFLFIVLEALPIRGHLPLNLFHENH